MPAPARNLFHGQLAFFACLGACVAVDRRGLWDNHGWSYYGGRVETAVPYALGFVLLVTFVLRTIALLEGSSAPGALAPFLLGLAVLLTLDLATPDTISSFFYTVHICVSVVLFVVELLGGVWAARRLLRTRVGASLVAVQLAGGLLAMFSQLQLIGLLGLGILLFQLSFGTILVLAVARATVEPERAPVPAEAVAGTY